MKAGGCSKARMISAAPPAVGSAAISAPMKGPERSTDHRGGHDDARRHHDFQQQADERRAARATSRSFRHRALARESKAANCSRATRQAPASAPAAEPSGSAARLSAMTARAKPPSPITALAITAAVAGPPTRWCKMIMMLVSTIGNTARLPLAVGPMRKLKRHDDADQQRRPCRRAAPGHTIAAARAASARGATAPTARRKIRSRQC